MFEAATMYFARIFFCRLLFLVTVAEIIFIFIFAGADLITRISILPSFGYIPAIIATMAPLLVSVTLPLAVGAGVVAMLGSSIEQGEWLVVHYLNRLEKTIWRCVWGAGFLVGCASIPLYFSLAPHSHWRGKELIVDIARNHFCSLDAGVLHTLAPGSMIFFARKQVTSATSMIFDNLLIAYGQQAADGSVSWHVISGEHGSLQDSTLMVHAVRVYTIDECGEHQGQMGHMQLDLEKLMGIKKHAARQLEISRATQLKYLDARELARASVHNPRAFVELHVRALRVLWLICMPALTLWLLLVGSAWGNVSTTLLGLAIVGGLFFVSYVHLMLVTALGNIPALALVVLYSPVVLASWFFWRRRKQRSGVASREEEGRGE